MQLLNSFFNFTTENMSESLWLLLIGMLGIFAVIGIIIVLTTLLNYFGNKIGSKDDKK